MQFKKGTSIESLGFKYDPEGFPITLSEEEIRKRFPLTYYEVCIQSRKVYSDFKQNNVFHRIMAGVKANKKLCYIIKLDSKNPKSPKKPLFSSNIFQELDKHYTRI